MLKSFYLFSPFSFIFVLELIALFSIMDLLFLTADVL